MAETGARPVEIEQQPDLADIGSSPLSASMDARATVTGSAQIVSGAAYSAKPRGCSRPIAALR
jgi:hypothetical protein